MANKYAIVDIGSNSIRYAEEMPEGLPNKEIYTTRLGAGLASTGRLSPGNIEASLSVLRMLGARAVRGGFIPRAYATSAVRDSDNGAAFARRVSRECAVPVEILSGEQEARFAFSGAALHGADTMLDIGGASMQVVTERYGASFRAGCVRCGDIAREKTGLPDCDTQPRLQQRAVEEYMDGVISLPELRIKKLVGVGGTITTLAALEAGCTEFDRAKAESIILTPASVDKLINILVKMGDERRRHPLLRARHDVILYGAYILRHAMGMLGVSEMSVSCSDGMEGYLKVLGERENGR